MDVVSLLHYHHDRRHWLRLVAFVALLWLFPLLAFVVGGVEIGPTPPAEGILVGPFRWDDVPMTEG